MNVIFGLLIIAAGTMIVIKSEQIFQNFGRIAFFEKYLGTDGGSRLGYKLAGLVVIFAGLLVMTGMGSGFMETALSPLISKQ
jgi:hypothetical protein